MFVHEQGVAREILQGIRNVPQELKVKESLDQVTDIPLQCKSERASWKFTTLYRTCFARVRGKASGGLRDGVVFHSTRRGKWSFIEMFQAFRQSLFESEGFACTSSGEEGTLHRFPTSMSRATGPITPYGTSSGRWFILPWRLWTVHEFTGTQCARRNSGAGRGKAADAGLGLLL